MLLKHYEPPKEQVVEAHGIKHHVLTRGFYCQLEEYGHRLNGPYVTETSRNQHSDSCDYAAEGQCNEGCDDERSKAITLLTNLEHIHRKKMSTSHQRAWR